MSIQVNLMISLVLFGASLALAHRYRPSRRLFFCYAALSTLWYLLIFIYVIADRLTGKGIDEAFLYHFIYGITGAGILPYWKTIACGIALLAFYPTLLWWLFRRPASRIASPRSAAAVFLLLLLAIASEKAVADLYRLFAAPKRGGDFYQYYSRPQLERTGERRNFVLIYLESIEQTYFDEKLFPGLVPNLKRLASKAVTFDNISQVRNTGWTMAGIVASQCGLPLVVPTMNSMAGMDTFLNNAVCLSDLLHEEGYYQVFTGGAYLDFAGKGKFFATHRYDEIFGRDQLLPHLNDRSYLNSWGLYDDTLLALAFKKYLQLKQGHDHFGLTVLTIDTHDPDGMPSKSCADLSYGDGSSQILNAVACTDRLVGEFVDRIVQADPEQSTEIILVSDHFVINNEVVKRLETRERRNLFMVLDRVGKKEGRIDRPGSTLDIAPTLASFLGYSGKIGFGRDLRASGDAGRSCAQEIEGYFPSWHDNFAEFWGFPRIREQVTVDLSRKEIAIDDRTFALPILVKLDRRLGTELIFQNYRRPGEKSLIDQVRELDPGERVLYVDLCSKVGEATASNLFGFFCGAIGTVDGAGGSRKIAGKIFTIENSVRLEQRQIEGYLNGT